MLVLYYFRTVVTRCRCNSVNVFNCNCLFHSIQIWGSIDNDVKQQSHCVLSEWKRFVPQVCEEESRFCLTSNSPGMRCLCVRPLHILHCSNLRTQTYKILADRRYTALDFYIHESTHPFWVKAKLSPGKLGKVWSDRWQNNTRLLFVTKAASLFIFVTSKRHASMHQHLIFKSTLFKESATNKLAKVARSSRYFSTLQLKFRACFQKVGNCLS